MMSLRCVFSDVKCTPKLRSRQNIDDSTAEIIRRRAGLMRVDGICSYKNHVIVDLFPLSHKKCCNPFGKHSKPSTLQLRLTTLEMVHRYKTVLPAPLVPGKKLCTNCVKALNERLVQYENAKNNPAKIISQQTEVSFLSPFPVSYLSFSVYHLLVCFLGPNHFT